MNHLSWKKEYFLGLELFREKYLKEAIKAFQNAVRLNPNAVEANHDLGVALYHNGQYESALSCFQKVNAINNRIVSAWFNGGNALCTLKRFEDAVSWLMNALQLSPNDSRIHFNLANIHKHIGQDQDAIFHYRAAINNNPELFEAYNNMGTLLLKDGHYEQAITCLKKALEVKHDFYNAAFNLGLTLHRLGRIGEGLHYTSQSLKINPESGEALALMVSMLQQQCEWTALTQMTTKLRKKTELQLSKGKRPSESPFLSFTYEPDPVRNKTVAEAWSRWLINNQKGVSVDFKFNSRRSLKKKITIGYLSGRLRNTATGHLVSGLFSRHDRDQFHIIAYSWGVDDKSYYRSKIKRSVDSFVDIQNLSDLMAAQRIYDDKVDILIDLMGWMHGNRMGILAKRAAPVQVNYLGFPGTSGAPFIDYILADRIVIPPSQRDAYTEKVIYLPDCYQVNDPESPIAKRPVRRTDYGLPETGFVFCSFNNDYKIESALFDVWMNILRSVSESVLWLLIRTPEARRNLRREARSRGVHPKRLIFAEPLPKDKHLARLKLSDLALDTLTVNGHTTSVDALLAGVPYIALQGSHFASRVGSSILNAIGLSELITYDLAGYERLAIRLARNISETKAIKSKLNLNKESYPLFKTKNFVRNFESALKKMWEDYSSE